MFLYLRSVPAFHRPYFRPALFAVLGMGLLIWGINYVYDRPLFLDEANLARNLYDRSFAGLFRPLDHEQYAPPLYLLLTKLLAELLGYLEYVLRLPALLGGIIGIVALFRAGQRLQLGHWTLLPLALLFVNPTVLHYVTEFKPYGTDLGVAACLLAAELRPARGNKLAWGLAGVLLPWVSLPSVFVLAAIGLRRLRTDIRWLAVIGLWLASFGVLYYLVLRTSVGSSYLNDFHAPYFMPLPFSGEALQQSGTLFFSLLRLTYGFTVAALLWGASTLLIGLCSASVRRHAWLLLPLLVSIAASHFRLYTLIDRLMLFALPGVWLFTAVAARWIYTSLSKWPGYAYLAAVLITLGGTNIYRAVLRPYRFNDGRRLAELAEGNVPYVADLGAVPVLDYYLRVKPERSGPMAINRPEPGAPLPYRRVRVLFDGTNHGPTRQVIREYEQRATERGCNVSWIEFYLSGSLDIKCP
ncbi:hypothetical protein CLV84_3247 [Neolewinella xylanilytica]|uniref:Dolichyl-phosphate-mannose-protein mannosyltransferase n=1 Tax=Neolewinella xylanilytica TaxID=1514080 RepID=A0A2S6I596_9BACT|nr:hypothetical protein CLV84_3247 [Neolewinella xylanilytica]